MLGLAVSNIAWSATEDDAVARVLRDEGVSAIEIAPTKWRADPLDATAAEIAAYRDAWADRGMRIVSLQSLLFGRPDLELFGSSRSRLADYLRRTIELGAGLGARALVFGSPKNRLRGSLSLGDAIASAAEFFRDVGQVAAEHGVIVAIEANPPEYGCDFITRTSEAVALCRSVASVGVGVNGDLGGMTMSGDDPRVGLEVTKGCLAHFHASEPNLAELGAEADHSAAAAGLDAIGYDGWVSIEMRAARTDGQAADAGTARSANVAAVERAVRLAKRSYRTAT